MAQTLTSILFLFFFTWTVLFISGLLTSFGRSINGARGAEEADVAAVMHMRNCAVGECQPQIRPDCTIRMPGYLKLK